MLEPTLLILDEPTEGIQPNIVHEIGDIILRLNQEAGVTVLLVEQKLPFARRVASEFRILEKGRCVAGGAIERLDRRGRARPSQRVARPACRVAFGIAARRIGRRAEDVPVIKSVGAQLRTLHPYLSAADRAATARIRQIDIFVR